MQVTYTSNLMHLIGVENDDGIHFPFKFQEISSNNIFFSGNSNSILV